jgi:hypothetical protein
VSLSNTKYEERKAKNLCIQCEAPTNRTVRCETCTSKARESRNRRREIRKINGLCTECGVPVEGGRILCKSCIGERSVVSTNRYYKNKEAGVCRFCGNHSRGMSRCESCRKKYKAWRRNRAEAGKGKDSNV